VRSCPPLRHDWALPFRRPLRPTWANVRACVPPFRPLLLPVGPSSLFRSVALPRGPGWVGVVGPPPIEVLVFVDHVSSRAGGSVREEPVTHCRVCRHLCRCFPTMVAVDYSRPLEAVIPGTTGKVLGVLARTLAELPIRRVAQLGGVSRDRASIEIRRLVVLGIVSRREVAGASLVKLERTNVAAVALLALADARSTAITRLSELAKSIGCGSLEDHILTCLPWSGS